MSNNNDKITMLKKHSEKNVDSAGSLRWSPNHCLLVFVLISVLSISTRFYKVSEPDHVCWDEVHFGKMGSWYINRTFFFDVHPPLGKMLIALSGYATGYDGSFAFDKPGDKYGDVKYIGMRVFCTFLGACIAPLAYLIVLELRGSATAAFLSSMMIICDVGVLTLTQYILLDPILLFFIMMSTYGIVKFNGCTEDFSKVWWFWLTFTGSMLACAISVKFVGLFVVLLCGMFTVWKLWQLLGDHSKPMKYILKHFVARIFGLIVLPALLYLCIFYIHLTVLNRSGNGDGFFSSAFQSVLEGNSLHNASMPREVAYGSIVTLKNRRTGGGYLHSHWHLYPEGVGARQQQCTTYTHKDDNNKFLIKPYNSDPPIDEIRFLKNGDLIRLEHVPTRRNLHSHREPAPITKKHLQVTGYGENGTGDPNDVWKVAVVSGDSDGIVTTVSTQIRFVHYLQHCVLTTTGKQLPAWAYEQQEVTCNPNLRDVYAVWNVEENFFPKLPNVSFNVFAPGFFAKVLESHAVMLQGNAGLKPKEGEITSRPWQWPINYRGQFFSGNSYRIYLLGNPIIWWGNICLLLCFMIVASIHATLTQRGCDNTICLDETSRVLSACVWLFIGWALHYIPFFAMGRVLYFHHYFPALLYSSMLSGVLIDFFINTIPSVLYDKWRSMGHHIVSAPVLGIIVYSFVKFSPLAYGMSGPYSSDVNSTMHGLKWLDSWEF
ncbi:dolichyl-phosphate-mannose-protein mannosyltransferase activity [Nesidiocoris tenuis]|uniref:Protein O-mannosyl-transferase 2 n=1 Tax=Nesidiocoris tenuis TaxID=355587 RepID=A0ABN7AJQ0_9HEMI|nr:dolichyl-phosphate-mannose-protein mannosyltransferase activity [Nesidiocoris tenuis]